VPSHRDLLQAHRLMTQRSALALISGEPDSPNQPLRRLNVGTISSLLAGAIAAAVFAVLGLISPGGATGSAAGLTQTGTLVVDSASATAYVPCESGKLCPALNYTSALLALDSASVRRIEVSPAALAHYSLGPTIGVAGLPQDLPLAQNLVTGPWAVCATTAGTTLVGGHTVGGTPLGPGSAALATTGQGDVWVLWNGQRLAIQPSVAQTLFPAMQVQTVPAAWLNAVPEGAPFAAPHIPGQGTQVTGPDGLALVGQVFDQPGSGGAAPQYYALLADGKLAHITATQAQLLAREPGAQATQAISPSLATANLSQTTIPRGTLPATIPAVAPIRSALCVTYGSALQRHIVTGATVPSGATSVGATSSEALTQVWLPPAHGALIGAAPGTTSSGVTVYFLLTGATRYALPARSVAAVLGYDLKTRATVLPSALLDLLPSGPPLNPSTATKAAASPAG
jgi:type VII secretion protein EccB